MPKLVSYLSTHREPVEDVENRVLHECERNISRTARHIPRSDHCISWPHASLVLVFWLNDAVLM